MEPGASPCCGVGGQEKTNTYCKGFMLGIKRIFSSVFPWGVRQWRRSPWETVLSLSLENFNPWLVKDLNSQVCPQGRSFRIALYKSLWPRYGLLKWESELYGNISFFRVTTFPWLHYFSLIICLMVTMPYDFCDQGKIYNVNTVSNVIHRWS